jgi:glycosyltransferase involved in cell wall biosynthesis
MKILIITDAWHPQVNGVVRTYEHMNEALIKRGHEVQVISPNDFKWRMPMPGYSEIDLTLLPYPRLKKLIEAANADHIHIATEGPLGIAARKYCVKTDTEFSTAYHTQFPDYIAKRIAKPFPFLYKPVHERIKRMVRWFHAPASVMFVATQSLEDEMRAWGFQTPIARLTRGVKLDQFTPRGEGEEAALFKDLKAPIALYVGRIAIEKNIEAFLQMEWDGTKVLVGDGPSRTYLSKKYPGAQFVGKKEAQDLAAHYRDADLFVFPSRTDTFGMVLIEAMASGLPIAAYNVTGPKDIVVEEYLGALDEDDLSKAAKTAINKGTTQERASHARTHYTWDKVAEQFEAAITGDNPNS